MLHEIFEASISAHQTAIEKSFTSAQIQILETITAEIIRCFRDGRKLMLCGNGGSASDSQHIAAEFVGRFHRERRGLPALALTTDTSILTAVANDYSYDDIFSRQIEALGVSGDVLIAISTSGNSKNVLKAVSRAQEMGIICIGFTGVSGGLLKDKTPLTFKAISPLTPHIQEVHITALHAISEAVEKVLFGS
ncbi:MAG: SIS domain-containing protein [Candidatus Omnitrophica bacterium]|nr:SIS domain-containing protein [Candidatus Omnitrophota bacterium]